MLELSSILIHHAKRYPLMTPCDVVKLLYQNEFGGGHMIADPEGALRRLREEYACVSLTGEWGAGEPVEPIGNGMVRVHLSAVAQGMLTLEALHRCFVASANCVRGSLDSFEAKLREGRILIEEGAFGFDRSAWETYLDGYRKQGFPAVSHSEIYRATYHPSYRVILQKFLP